MSVRTMFPMLLGAMLLIGYLSFSVNGEGQADAPEWKKGDGWSMGYETDLGEMISSLIDGFEEIEEENGSIDHDIEGKAGYYMVFKISEASDTRYTMDISTGGGLDIDGNAKITTDMPKEGEYSYDSDNWDYEPPMESMEISVDLDLDVSMMVDGTAHFTTDGLKLEDLDLAASLKGNVDLKVVNFPEIEYDYDETTYEEIMTVDYTDYDLSGSADIKLTLKMDFDPPMDIFNFPVEEGEEWMAESTVTVSGTYEGTVDAEGIPEEFMMELLEDNIVFPIILEELDTDIDEVKNGIIAVSELPLSIPVSCTGTETVKLADGSSSEAYVIQFGYGDDDDYYDDEYYEEEYYDDEYSDDEYLEEEYYDDEYSDDEYYDDEYSDDEYYDDDYYDDDEESLISGLPGMVFLYCPEEGFFVSAQMEGIGEGLDLDGSTGSMDTFELKPMSTDEAEKNM
ncbi:MAG: hypothetical protein ACMUIG_08670, partial [Thermoplasmatota archaeon]